MQDLYDLLKEQTEFIPIARDTYFYDKGKNQFYCRHYGHIRPFDGSKKNKDDNYFYLLLDKGKTIGISKYKLLCYFQNGLLPNMSSISDSGYAVIKSDNTFKWVTTSEKLMQHSKAKLEKVFQEHPELYVKEGFYDERVIPYKRRDGFYIVPLTNGTLAMNPVTQEAVSTYSNELLIPQFHERGDRKFHLNKRLTGGLGALIASRAIAFLTLPIPNKYKHLGIGIKEIVKNLDVDHIDSNPSNNSISNLQYLTRQENLIKKLNQEVDPRVFPSTWLSPDGKEVRFRSYRDAAIQINCNLAALEKICKGWRDINEINGWKLIEGRLPHPLENIYSGLERMGIARTQLTLFKGEYSVYDTTNKEFHLFSTLDKLCDKFNIFVSGLETHIAKKGPLVPYRNLVVFPYRYMNPLLSVKYFDNFVKE